MIGPHIPPSPLRGEGQDGGDEGLRGITETNQGYDFSLGTTACKYGHVSFRFLNSCYALCYWRASIFFGGGNLCGLRE